MSSSILKTILIALKLFIISVLLIRGLIQHCKMKDKNMKVIALLLIYLVMLLLICIAELFYEFIPLFFGILNIASALQVYQVSIFVDYCASYVPERNVKINKVVLVIFSVAYLILFCLTFAYDAGPRCGKLTYFT